MYEDYENGFVNRLNMSGVEVSALPTVDALNDPRPATRPTLYVMYNGSSYSDPENMAATTQKETLNFEVFIKAKSRRGKNGIFVVSEEVKGRLMGWRPAGAITPVILSSFGYVAGNQNNWQYMLTFEFTRYVTQRDFAEPTETIKQITMQ